MFRPQVRLLSKLLRLIELTWRGHPGATQGPPPPQGPTETPALPVLKRRYNWFQLIQEANKYNQKNNQSTLKKKQML